MRLTALLSLLLVSSIALADSVAPALLLYIAQDSEIPDSRYIDTPSFPKLGYISNTPSSQITSLKDVSVGDPVPWQHFDKQQKLLESGTHQQLIITLREADAKAFAALTDQAIGHHILIALGNRLLLAPLVSRRIDTESISISFPTVSERDVVEKELRTLIHK